MLYVIVIKHNIPEIVGGKEDEYCFVHYQVLLAHFSIDQKQESFFFHYYPRTKWGPSCDLKRHAPRLISDSDKADGCISNDI